MHSGSSTIQRTNHQNASDSFNKSNSKPLRSLFSSWYNGNSTRMKSSHCRVNHRTSLVNHLMPILDDNGLLWELCVCHPIILPSNAETVVNEIRHLYNNPRLRLVVKKVSRDCAVCKIHRARPIIPPMAPLPPACFAHHERPFTFTG